MNDMERLFLIVVAALACPLVIPVLLDNKEDKHEVSGP